MTTKQSLEKINKYLAAIDKILDSLDVVAVSTIIDMLKMQYDSYLLDRRVKEREKLCTKFNSEE